MPFIMCTGLMPEIVAETLSPYGRVVVASDHTADEKRRILADTIAIAARADVRVTPEVIAAAPLLRVIGRSGAGVDNVDLPAASARSIPVVFTPDSGTDAVAEGTFAMLLSLVKRLPELDQAVRSGRWRARDTIGIGDLAGAALGIVGLGRIGRRVAELSGPFRVHVLGCDPYLPPGTQLPSGMRLTSLEALFAEADLITVHAQLTKESAGLIDRRLLAACRPGAILVNAGRGGLIRSLDDLCEALDAGRLAGVGLDVFPDEPPDTGHPLFSDPRVLLSPHALGLSAAARRRTFADMSTGMAAALRGERPSQVANPEIYQAAAKGK